MKYLRLLKNTWINRLNYRGEFISSIVFGGFIFIGQAIFWRAVFLDKELVKGFTYSDMLIYYIFVRILSDIVDSRLGFKISEMIITGRISSLLLKPVKIRMWVSIEEFGQALFGIFINSVVFIVLFTLFIGPVSIDIYKIPLFIIGMFFSFGISSNVFFIIGCSAFWSENSKYVNYSLKRIFLFFSGAILPLVFFPSWIQEILKYLPFEYIFNFPIKILFGSYSWTQILGGYLVQIVWIFVSGILTRKLFSILIKYNESVGI